MSKLSKELARQAAQFGICDEWHDELLTLNDKRRMIEMYLKGIDFCLSNDYPDNEFIRKHFVGVIEQYNVYLDNFVTLINPKQVVALGETSGTIKVDEYNVCQVYVKHDSKLKIKASNHSFVMIDLFDDASVEIEASGDAKVCVNRYGNTIVVFEEKDNSRVKIIEKNKKTY